MDTVTLPSPEVRLQGGTQRPQRHPVGDCRGALGQCGYRYRIPRNALNCSLKHSVSLGNSDSRKGVFNENIRHPVPSARITRWQVHQRRSGRSRLWSHRWPYPGHSSQSQVIEPAPNKGENKEGPILRRPNTDLFKIGIC